MLTINHSTASKRVTPNILPCEIAYTGKVDASKHFWNPIPETMKDENEDQNKPEQQVAYFRGRKLLGRTDVLPNGYRGVIVNGEKKEVVPSESQEQKGSMFSRIARRNQDEDDDDLKEDNDEANTYDATMDNGEDSIPLESMNAISTFQDITVWEHEAVPSTEEPFVKGIEEWLAFAGVIHDTRIE